MANKRVSLKGKGADLFFGDYAPTGQQPPQRPAADGDAPRPITEVALAPTEPEQQSTSVAGDAPTRPKRALPQAPHRSQAVVKGSDSSRASLLASDATDAIGAIRAVVRTPGREVSFVRLSPEEKAQLADIVYTYKRQGQKTTENEIQRIALNALLHDFDEHGETSVLARVLAALRA